MFPKEGAVISHHPSRNPALLVSLAAGRTYYFIVRLGDELFSVLVGDAGYWALSLPHVPYTRQRPDGAGGNA